MAAPSHAEVVAELAESQQLSADLTLQLQQECLTTSRLKQQLQEQYQTKSESAAAKRESEILASQIE